MRNENDQTWGILFNYNAGKLLKEIKNLQKALQVTQIV